MFSVHTCIRDATAPAISFTWCKSPPLNLRLDSSLAPPTAPSSRSLSGRTYYARSFFGGGW